MEFNVSNIKNENYDVNFTLNEEESADIKKRYLNSLMGCLAL